MYTPKIRPARSCDFFLFFLIFILESFKKCRNMRVNMRTMSKYACKYAKYACCGWSARWQQRSSSPRIGSKRPTALIPHGRVISPEFHPSLSHCKADRVKVPSKVSTPRRTGNRCSVDPEGRRRNQSCSHIWTIRSAISLLFVFLILFVHCVVPGK